MRAVLVFGAAALAGCVALPQPPIVERPEWVPAQGIEWARAQCDARAAGVSGYDWIDAISKRIDARVACLKSFGLSR